MIERMEISRSRFIQLTALIAAGGTLAAACTVNNIKEQSSQGGAGGSVSADTGGAGATGLTTGGATGTSTATGGGSSSAGSVGTGGTTGNVAGSTGNSGGTAAGTGGTSNVNTLTSTGGAGGNTDATGGASAIGGKSGTGGATGTATGGTSAMGGTSAATGGTSAATGGSSSLPCVSGDPAGESLGFDCTQLSFFAEQCDNPTGEGTTVDTYGAVLCTRYAEERVGSVKVFTDCLKTLTAPASGWCGTDHKTAVDTCRSQMLTRTCASSTAQTACANIHSICSAVTVANCVADLSPLDDTEITGIIEPCMEGAEQPSSICEFRYRQCAGYPDLTVGVTDSCNQLIQGCSGINLQTCKNVLDIYGSGFIYESTFKDLYVGCMQTEQDAGSTCLEAFTTCAG